MGTNYYGRKIPTESDQISIIVDAANSDYAKAKQKLEEITETVHIGKSSAGWNFLFNLNGSRFYTDATSLLDWLNSVQITDEYGRKYSCATFWNDVVSNRMWNGKPTKTHLSETKYPEMYTVIDGLEFLDSEFS